MKNQFNIYEDYRVSDYNFDFMGEYILTNSKYFLNKKRVIWSYDNKEYVFAKELDNLSIDYLEKNLLSFTDFAMKNLVQVDENHMSTAITLFVSTNHIDKILKSKIPKIKKRKSYMLGLKGYSSLRIILFDKSTNEFIYNCDSKDVIHFYKEVLL
ncbi:hypothetical protein QJS64_16505 [Paraclostridium bifermentans]|uniref:DUF8052 domain-containing protein n=1 Tax=Paraclostridium bifermentans TaxID=1490 RepID=A0ABY8R1X8_PARBF|nr:hypothetical protein QJS64_16505 [Paraclostridium bifermentans]